MTSDTDKLLNLKLDQRPIVVAVAGPNGSGKSTFYNTYLLESGLPFVNADVLAADLGLDAYVAAGVADDIRHRLIDRRESFVFETVFSSPAGEKLLFLQDAVKSGYAVVLFFIGISGPDVSDRRVSMRVAQGGHDVPQEKLMQRYPRTLQNLKAALSLLPSVYVIDNSNLRKPFQLIAQFENGRAIFEKQSIPEWLGNILTGEDKPQP